MNNDFNPIYPSPQELLKSLCKLFPEFKSYWDQPDNCFTEVDGSFTYHGLFSEFTSYIRDTFPKIDENKWKELFLLIEKYANTDPMSENGVSNAVFTCFLENLAGEGALSQAILPYLGPKSREYFDQWNQSDGGEKNRMRINKDNRTKKYYIAVLLFFATPLVHYFISLKLAYVYGEITMRQFDAPEWRPSILTEILERISFVMIQLLNAPALLCVKFGIVAENWKYLYVINWIIYAIFVLFVYFVLAGRKPRYLHRL